ncbi:MAG: uracil-DNA glycosylase [Chloroflexi bacterium]|nr:uracil-DNA glycosylase [Chloroflexota bacterium]
MVDSKYYPDNRTNTIESIIELISKCTSCTLSLNRTNTVPGEGSINSKIVFIGEAPGAQEDKSGRPFVGAAGKVLDKLLNLINLSRKDIYITNMVKCRPPNNRDPLDKEILSCKKFLDSQLEFIKPKLIVPLGRHSFNKFFPNENLSKNRGQIKKWGNYLLYPVYHPAAALHNPNLKTTMEDDFIKIKKLIYESNNNQKLITEQKQLKLL